MQKLQNHINEADSGGIQATNTKPLSYHVVDQNLTYTLVKKTTLNQAQKSRMYELMTQNYIHHTEDLFLKDLDKKQYVGLVHDDQWEIQGFTTYAINPANCGTDSYNIIFSGDTIINPTHWGTQIMSKGWSYTIGMMIKSDFSKNWYWYLMSKGHRTYLYLPLFFKEFYPSPYHCTNDLALSIIADQTSQKMFQQYWKKDLGIIRFDESHGALKTEMTEATFKKRNSPYVSFFLDRNPGFVNGDELVCIVPLTLENLIRSAREYCDLGLMDDLENVS